MQLQQDVTYPNFSYQYLHLSKPTIILIFIDILLCIKWKVFCDACRQIFTYPNIFSNANTPWSNRVWISDFLQYYHQRTDIEITQNCNYYGHSFHFILFYHLELTTFVVLHRGIYVRNDLFKCSRALMSCKRKHL